ncbi:metallophosphoesterase family protein [uncultured Bacteroides sp.]|uniref:metallophosphoesterase family protein n=1 Tax=uncultured Bacteroides sp. TaxID=162156 RepID=UPI002AAB7677|nr:metallophosphoesterase family protein [uncultured Bacteroides sp.]
MKKVQVLLVMLLLAVTLPSLAKSPELKFRNDKFKIIQFTDIHWNSDHKYKIYNDSTEMMMRQVIEAEKPDLVILTGDISVSKGAKEGWEQVTRPMTDLKVPFAVTFGNHDTESDMPKLEVLKYLQSNPFNLTQDSGEEVDGVGNSTLAVKSSESDKDSWLIYLFDSHAYTNDSIMGYYDWIKKSQIDWYVDQSNKFTEKNGEVVPALAFFHIPLPEYEYVRNQKSTLGNHSEEVCSPRINSGLFWAFLQQKDVMATFVGHDHNDDFIGSLANIHLAYGRKSGYVNAYKEILERGARVIELHEKEKEVRTYIRTLSGTSLEYSFKK